MGVKLLRDSRSVQLMLTWSYRQKKLPVPPQGPDPTPPQRSAQQPILGMPMQTAPQQQAMLGMPMQTAPPQQSTTMQAIITPANTVFPMSSRAAGVSTSRLCTIAANTSESIGYFKPVEYTANSSIG
jgi:hypothetical protein